MAKVIDMELSSKFNGSSLMFSLTYSTLFFALAKTLVQRNYFIKTNLQMLGCLA
jgi:hypothetical protein